MRPSSSFILVLGVLAVTFPVIGQCVPPQITVQPSDVTACIGGSALISVEASGSKPAFIWFKDGVNIDASSTATLAITSVTTADAGVYMVWVINGCGVAASQPATLTVKQPVAITSGPDTVTRCPGQSATFTVTLAGDGPYTIEWATNRSRGDYIDMATPTITLDNLTVMDGGAVSVRVSNACSTATATAELHMHDVPIITMPPHGHAAAPGGAAVMSVTAIGVPPISYQWLKNGALIPGATEPNYWIRDAAAGDEGLYQVVVSNGCGRVDSDQVPFVLAEPTARGWAEVSGGTDGPVNALLSFDDGSGAALYAGGDFTLAGSLGASRVARFRDGAWESVGSGMDAAVHALALFDSGRGPELYAGGEFTMADGKSIARIARWTGHTWVTVGAGIQDGVVRTLFSFRGILYAGGTFTIKSGRGGLVAWDGASWSLVGGGLAGSVYALEAFDDGTGPKLYVGGDFPADARVPAANLVRWSGAWSAIPGPSPSMAVRALLAWDDGNGTDLYVGGEFQRFLGMSGIARWNGIGWSGVGQGLGPGPVYALAKYDDGVRPGLYAAGNFALTTAGVPSTVAVWRTGVWTGMEMGSNRAVRTLAVHLGAGSSDLYAGGDFDVAGRAPAHNVAVWKGAFTLAFSQPLGSGSAAIVNSFGAPLANYFTALSAHPGNAAAPGGGPWYGLFISTDEFLAQIANGAPPYVGALDDVGTSILTLPAGTLSRLAGAQFWGVTVTYDPSAPAVMDVSSLASITIR